MEADVIPPDFPGYVDLGAVPGVQPKLLVRLDEGRYVTGANGDELRARFEMCEDLARQLVQYTSRKRTEHPEWSREHLHAKVAAGLKAKAFGWGLSPAETNWVLRRVARLTGPS